MPEKKNQWKVGNIYFGLTVSECSAHNFLALYHQAEYHRGKNPHRRKLFISWQDGSRERRILFISLFLVSPFNFLVAPRLGLELPMFRMDLSSQLILSEKTLLETFTANISGDSKTSQIDSTNPHRWPWNIWDHVFLPWSLSSVSWLRFIPYRSPSSSHCTSLFSCWRSTGYTTSKQAIYYLHILIISPKGFEKQKLHWEPKMVNIDSQLDKILIHQRNSILGMSGGDYLD